MKKTDDKENSYSVYCTVLPCRRPLTYIWTNCRWVRADIAATRSTDWEKDLCSLFHPSLSVLLPLIQLWFQKSIALSFEKLEFIVILFFVSVAVMMAAYFALSGYINRSYFFTDPFVDLMTLEEEKGITIPDEELMKFVTVQDILDYLEKHVN